MGWFTEALGTAGDGFEMAGQFGLKAAEEVPLVSTAIHTGIGAYDVYEMEKHRRDGDAAGWQAQDDHDSLGPFGLDNPDSDAQLQQEASKQHDEAQNYGHDAESQFFQAIPLIGTAYGMAGLATKASRAIEPAVKRVVPDYVNPGVGPGPREGLFGEEI
jgi:hypothetical protein